jgi:SAM-dependent methyltransferase
MTKAKQEIIDMWNKTSDSDWYNSYRTDEAINAIRQNPSSAFPPTTFSMLKEFLGDFKDKKVLVPSSGDNHAVFAFCLLGAQVTSADISERQIENAQAIADKQNWHIRFLVDDTMTLEAVDDVYDLVYTSNGVFVWIDDLPSMFTNVRRVLKDGGLYLFYDIHPFTRPFSDSDPAELTKLMIKKPYSQTDVGINNHWRIQDLLNALITSGLSIEHIEEMYPEFGTYWFESSGGRNGLSDVELKKLYDWKSNPLAALPAWLSVCSRKR